MSGKFYPAIERDLSKFKKRELIIILRHLKELCHDNVILNLDFLNYKPFRKRGGPIILRKKRKDFKLCSNKNKHFFFPLKKYKKYLDTVDIKNNKGERK